MATVAETFMFMLGADTSALKRDLAQADAMMQNGVKGILGHIAGPVAAAASFGYLFSQFLQGSEAVGAFSQKTGLAVRDVSAWSAAVEDAGGSAQGFQSDIASMQEKLDYMRRWGRSELSPWFWQLGITTRKAGGEMKNSLDILPELAGKIEGMKPVDQRALLRKMGFGEDTVALLQQGRKAVEESVRQQSAFATTREDAEAAREWNRSLTGLIRSLQSVANVLFRAVLPWFSKALDVGARIMAFLNRHKPLVLAFFGALATIIATRMTPALLKMAAAWLANPLTWIIAGVAALALALDDLWTYLNGGPSHFAKLWQAMGLGPQTLETLRNAWQALKDAVSACIDWIRDKWNALVEGFKNSPIIKDIMAIVEKLEWLRGKLTGSGTEGAKRLHEGDLEPEAQAMLDDAGVSASGASQDTGEAESEGEATRSYVAAGVEAMKNVGSSIRDFFSGKTLGLFGSDKGDDTAPEVASDVRAAYAEGPAMAARASGKGETRVNSDVTFQNVTVNTQATDGEALAKDFPKAMAEHPDLLAMQVQTGVVQK